MAWLGARVVVAGTHSGVGKTTVATGLMAAFRARGFRVGSGKVGPDFIDPGYHAVATGRAGRNLDPWLCGEAAVPALAAQAGDNTDILIIEGVLGLFDGASDGQGARAAASTAHVARLLQAPVLLVVDGSAMSGSVAAVVHGFATLDPDVSVAAVILNRVGSDGHEHLLREALAPLGVPVLGALHRDDRLQWRDRHLGLIPVVENEPAIRASVDALAGLVAAQVDLDEILAVAASAASVDGGAPPTASWTGSARVAVAAGPAFSFAYPETVELLEQAGAEILPFDPLVESAVPDRANALFIGGGFPEVYAAELAENRALLADVAGKADQGLLIWAECGGLLWLARSLDGRWLTGVLPADGRMTDHLTLGYRQATVRRRTWAAPIGTVLRGHEHHYSAVEPVGDALAITGRFTETRGGFATPTLLASYLHLHPSGCPEVVERFVSHASLGAGAPPELRPQ